MTEMDISGVFSDFCTGLHQDFTLHGSEPLDWINGALDSVAPERLALLREYIVGLLAYSYSDYQLSELIRATGTDTHFLEIHYPRHFLEMARDVIDGRLVR
mgnify:CR=1 FL=1